MRTVVFRCALAGALLSGPVVAAAPAGDATANANANANAATPTSSAKPAVKIDRLWTAYRDTASFLRLGGLPEKDREPGGAIVLRTEPEEREGFYFTVRLRGDALSEAKAVLHVVAPNAAEPRTFTFPFDGAGKRSTLLLVGLTGKDWTYGNRMPLAWKVEIVDSTGQVVASQQSFLWSKP